MARLRATPRPRDFQHPRDPIRLLAQDAQPKLRKDIREAFRHLRTIVPMTSLVGAIRRGTPRQAAAALIDHWGEVLKGVFNRLGDIRFEAADLGARRITADFRRAGRRVRYRKAFNPNEPRDERGRWTGGGGGAKSTTVNVGGRQVTAELSPVAAAVGDKLVTIDAMAFDRSFARDPGFYVGQHGEGTGGIGGRYGRFQDYLASHDSFQVSEVGVQDDGRVGFTNGRHRYAVLRDSGLRAIPVSMDIRSIANARRYGYLLGVNKFVKAIGDGFDFDRFDEETLDALRQTQDDLIAELSDQARDTVAYLIDRGVQAGDSADEIAATIRDTISLTERQAQAVANYRRLLEGLDQQALERELRNAEFDDAVQAAIDSGEVLSDSAIDDLVAEYADNYLDYRADTIARTESLRAANEGLRESYRQASDRGVFPAEAVTRNWLAAIDERTCPVCMSIVENNKDGVGLNDDFQSDDGPVDDPPVHPSCRCTVEYVTNLDMLPEEEAATEEDQAA